MNVASRNPELYGQLDRLRNQRKELELLESPAPTQRNDQFLDTYNPTQFPEFELHHPELPKLHQARETQGLLSRLWSRLTGG